MKIYTAYDPPPQVSLDSEYFGESLTKQSERDSCDINKIMARYQRSGVKPVGDREGFYADVSRIGDYREALESVANGEEMFMKIPSKVRAEFGNDPGAFLEFAEKEENYDRLVEIGLIDGKVVTKEIVKEPVDKGVEPLEE